jgi:hypothetical protein
MRRHSRPSAPAATRRPGLTCSSASTAVSRAFSACSALASPTASSLTTARHVSFLAPAAKASVEKVSAAESGAGVTVATMQVRELPPRLSCSKKVRRESRYGTCTAPPPRRCRSTSAPMTRPSTASERLMARASVSAPPVAPLRPTRSEPAKSMRLSLE